MVRIANNIVYLKVARKGDLQNSHSDGKKTVNKTVEKTVKTGISFGSALAMIISYTAYKSIGWAIFHGILSWIYVIYYIIRY